MMRMGLPLLLAPLLIGCGASAPSPGGSAGAVPPAAAAAGGTAAPVATLQLAYTTTNAGTTPMWLAQEAGLFREQGLETSLTRIPAGAPLLAALQNGDVAVAMAGGPQIVDAVLQGGDQVMVGSLTNSHTQALYGAAGIATVEALRGRAVGVSRHG